MAAEHRKKNRKIRNNQLADSDDLINEIHIENGRRNRNKKENMNDSDEVKSKLYQFLKEQNQKSESDQIRAHNKLQIMNR